MPKASVVFEGAGLKDSSKKLYLSQLTKLNDGKEPSNYKFLQDTEAIEKKLEKYSTNSKRTFYIAIVSFLPEKNKTRKFYYEKMMEINKATRDNTDKSEKQKENWLSQDEVREVWSKLRDEAESLLTKKSLNQVETKLLQSYVILSLFVLQPPRRSLDYTQMMVVPSFNENLDKQYNYLSLKDKTFYFNNYKTAGTYKTQTVPISDELFIILKKYRKSGLLLQNNEKALTSPQMTLILNKVFGKKISVSMLRNIYMTSKYSDESKALIKDAHDLGTSVNVAQSNYIKRD
jgi:integrase